jgi:hypothetical protein
MEVDQKLLAPCGLYCGVCGMYFATRDNNQKFLERLLTVYQGKLPGLEEMTIEDLKCEGCLSDRPSGFCSVCVIKNCTRQKGYAGCHECDGFPCAHIKEFPMPVGKKVILRAIPQWRTNGTEQWVKDEEARYVCPDCGHKLFRGAQRCNVCKVPVDLD